MHFLPITVTPRATYIRHYDFTCFLVFVNVFNRIFIILSTFAEKRSRTSKSEAERVKKRHQDCVYFYIIKGEKTSHSVVFKYNLNQGRDRNFKSFNNI